MSQKAINRKQQLEAFGRLLDIMDELRDKCPWDKKQTLESLTRLTIEEVYEAIEAIRNKDMAELEGELGDLFLHLVFYAKIGSESNAFDVESVLNKICDKLVYRHPHIYGDVVADDEEAVKRNWEQLKLKKGKSSVLEGVPNSAPALVRAQRIQEKAAGVGFDFDDHTQVIPKLEEEVKEMLAEEDFDLKKQEFGDIFFSLVNLARHLKIDSEESLTCSSNKFKKRFQWIEARLKEQNTSIDQISDKAILEEYWQKAKQEDYTNPFLSDKS